MFVVVSSEITRNAACVPRGWQPQIVWGPMVESKIYKAKTRM